uniref:Uncharacterized protein n=1 Tax=Apteryx owenii TaxID=8824 RepID=A0A8B9PAC3_APTOW
MLLLHFDPLAIDATLHHLLCQSPTSYFLGSSQWCSLGCQWCMTREPSINSFQKYQLQECLKFNHSHRVTSWQVLCRVSLWCLRSTGVKTAVVTFLSTIDFY